MENDSIDIEIRIVENLHINKCSVSGNTRTGDEVILRELSIMPEKIQSFRCYTFTTTALQLGYFNQENECDS